VGAHLSLRDAGGGGLVKNFAQAMELSQTVEDERELKRELSSMGVEGIPGISTDATANTPADD